MLLKIIIILLIFSLLTIVVIIKKFKKECPNGEWLIIYKNNSLEVNKSGKAIVIGKNYECFKPKIIKVKIYLDDFLTKDSKKIRGKAIFEIKPEEKMLKKLLPKVDPKQKIRKQLKDLIENIILGQMAIIIGSKDYEQIQNIAQIDKIVEEIYRAVKKALQRFDIQIYEYVIDVHSSIKF